MNGHILSRLEVDEDKLGSSNTSPVCSHGCWMISSREGRSDGRMARHLRIKSLTSAKTQSWETIS